MTNTLEMWTPLAVESALRRLVQGLCGSKHEVCSPLQRQACEHRQLCLGPDQHAFTICHKIVFGAYIEQKAMEENRNGGTE